MISYSFDTLVILMYNENLAQNIFSTFSLKKLFNIAKYSCFFLKMFLVLRFSLTCLILKRFYHLYIYVYICIYIIYIYIVKSFPVCSLTKYKIEKTVSYLHRTFWIALNCFSTVKSLNSAIAFTKNRKQIRRELLKHTSS